MMSELVQLIDNSMNSHLYAGESVPSCCISGICRNQISILNTVYANPYNHVANLDYATHCFFNRQTPG